MYKLLTLLAFILSASFLSAQVRTGQPAPGIHVGEWVFNAPSDPSTKRKFVVLEFWATWCAPCIKAVPHLNDLHAKFADRKDLYFISISDEEPGKIRRTLQKVDMRYNLFSQLLHIFGLRQSEETEMDEVYVLHVSDASKLEVSDDMVSHMSSSDHVALFGTIGVADMAKALSHFVSIMLLDETGLTGKYNFLINTETLGEMAKSLEGYGLEMKPERRELKYVRFAPKS